MRVESPLTSNTDESQPSIPPETANNLLNTHETREKVTFTFRFTEVVSRLWYWPKLREPSGSGVTDETGAQQNRPFQTPSAPRLTPHAESKHRPRALSYSTRPPQGEGDMNEFMSSSNGLRLYPTPTGGERHGRVPVLVEWVKEVRKTETTSGNGPFLHRRIY